MPGVRTTDNIVVWTLSVLTAAVFLFAGVPKVFGTETVGGLQAAAMHGFPQWMRVLVGALEIVGALALLVPRAAKFAAGLLAFLMIPAIVTQLASGEPGVSVPIAVLAVLLFIFWRRNSREFYDGYHGFADQDHPLLREGLVAGVLGAAAIAVWFFLVDLIGGRPFFTPRVLGQGLFMLVFPEFKSAAPVVFVLAYTVFHFAAFMLVGLIAALIVNTARREPSILLGFIVLFAATEVGFYAFSALLHEASSLGRLAWYQVMLGNILAATAMGTYFWRKHRELADEFRHSLDFEVPVQAQGAPRPPTTETVTKA